MERLNDMIKIRVSAEDRAAFMAAAAAEGLSMSAWARFHLKRLVKQKKDGQSNRRSNK